MSFVNERTLQYYEYDEILKDYVDEMIENGRYSTRLGDYINWLEDKDEDSNYYYNLNDFISTLNGNISYEEFQNIIKKLIKNSIKYK